MKKCKSTLALILIGLLLVSFGLSGIAVAQEGNLEIEHSPDDQEIQIEGRNYENNPNELELKISGVSETYPIEDFDNGTFKKEINYSELNHPDKELENVTVKATAGESNVSKVMDLRYIDFGEKTRQIDGVIAVFVEERFGYGSTVSVEVEGTQTSLEGAFAQNETKQALLIDPPQFKSLNKPLTEINISVDSASEKGKTNAIIEAPILYIGHDQLRISTPEIKSNVNYSVTVKEEGESVTETIVNANHSGFVDVISKPLPKDATIELANADEDKSLEVSNSKYTDHPNRLLIASQHSFEPLTDDINPSEIWISNGSHREHIDPESIDNRDSGFNISGSSISVNPDEGYEILLMPEGPNENPITAVTAPSPAFSQEGSFNWTPPEEQKSGILPGFHFPELPGIANLIFKLLASITFGAGIIAIVFGIINAFSGYFSDLSNRQYLLSFVALAGAVSGLSGLYWPIQGLLRLSMVGLYLIFSTVSLYLISEMFDKSDNHISKKNTRASRTSRKPKTGTISVTVQDPLTGSSVNQKLPIKIYRVSQRGEKWKPNPKPTDEGYTNKDGTYEITVKPNLNYIVKVNGVPSPAKSDVISIRRGETQPVSIKPDPQQLLVTISERNEKRNPISNVSVSLETKGHEISETTNSEGQATFQLPIDVDKVTVTATRSKFESQTETIDVNGSTSVDLSLAKKSGNLEIETMVDGVSTPDIPIIIEAKENEVKSLQQGPNRTTTGSNGTTSLNELIVGEYLVQTDITQSSRNYNQTKDHVTIQSGEIATLTLDIDFLFSLSSTQRDSIQSIESQIDDMFMGRTHDVTVQRYFGSVVSSLLDTAERLPNQGHKFIRSETEPDELIQKYLEIAREAEELVSTAMTTKRNTDLFVASSNLPDERVEFDKRIEVSNLFDWLNTDTGTRRPKISKNLENTKKHLNEERDQLPSIDPASEVWEQVRDWVRESEEDDVKAAIRAFIAEQLLEAVEQSFEEPAIRKRYEQTIY